MREDKKSGNMLQSDELSANLWNVVNPLQADRVI